MRVRIQLGGEALPAWARRQWRVLLGLGVVVLIGIGIVLSFVLAMQTEELLRDVNAVVSPAPVPVATASSISTIPTPSISDKDRADLKRGAYQYQADNLSKIWTTIVQGLGAVVVAIGGYVGWKNFEATKQASEKNLEVAQQQQISNRFTKAVEQLAADGTDVRLGGIYALEQVADDSTQLHGPVMEILTAWLREHTRGSVGTERSAITAVEDVTQSQLRLTTPTRADFQAIITVLARRAREATSRNERPLDLRNVSLPRYRFSGRGRAEPAGKWNGANFRGADLQGASFDGAKLFNAQFANAQLQETDFSYADLAYADFTRALLDGAIFRGANLHHATLNHAQLKGADFRDANLTNAGLTDAHIEQVKQEFLTKEQIYSAFAHGKDAWLPPDWSPDWRDRFQEAAEQPAAAPPVLSPDEADS